MIDLIFILHPNSMTAEPGNAVDFFCYLKELQIETSVISYYLSIDFFHRLKIFLIHDNF